MKIRTLLRSYLPDRTIGKLGKFKTLERPWLANKPYVSCVPEDVYLVLRDHNGIHRFYRLQDTSPRTAIEVHGGVFPHNSEGCILLGTKHTKEYNLAGSDEALAEFLAEQGEDSFILEIRQYNPSLDGEF